MPRVTLVLLPGLDGTGIMFEPLLRHLPADWQPVVVQYPGDQCLGYDDLLPIVRSSLPRDEPFVLLGESFSGPLAIRLAAERPRGMCGVVLCATFATSPAPWFPRSFGGVVQAWLVAPLRSGGRFAARLLGFSAGELRELFARAQRQVAPDVLAARVRSTLNVDVTSELKQVAVPMLYLAARRDHIVSRKCLRQIEKLRPETEVRIFNAPHWVLQSRPQEVVAELRSFVERCGSKPAETTHS